VLLDCVASRESPKITLTADCAIAVNILFGICRISTDRHTASETTAHGEQPWSSSS
jgi:hypothetical protein